MSQLRNHPNVFLRIVSYVYFVHFLSNRFRKIYIDLYKKIKSSEKNCLYTYVMIHRLNNNGFLIKHWNFCIFYWQRFMRVWNVRCKQGKYLNESSWSLPLSNGVQLQSKYWLGAILGHFPHRLTGTSIYSSFDVCFSWWYALRHFHDIRFNAFFSLTSLVHWDSQSAIVLRQHIAWFVIVLNLSNFPLNFQEKWQRLNNQN